MSYYSDVVSSKMGTVLTSFVDIKETSKVPETTDIKLEKNEGFLVQATYVYADLVGSSILAHRERSP